MTHNEDDVKEDFVLDKNKAIAFHKELSLLQERYGIYVAARYEEEVDFDYDEMPFSTGGSAYVVYVDECNNAHAVEDIEEWM